MFPISNNIKIKDIITKTGLTKNDKQQQLVQMNYLLHGLYK